MKPTSKLILVLIALVFATACTTSPDIEEGDSMEFTEEEVAQEEVAPEEDEMSFTEDEVEEAEGLEFTEEEVDANTDEEGLEFSEEEGTVIGSDEYPPEGQWLLHNGAGYMECPNVEVDIEEGDDVTATLEWLDTQGYIFVLNTQEGSIGFTPYGFDYPAVANWLGVIDAGGLELKYFVNFYDIDGGILKGHISSIVVNESGNCLVFRSISGEYLGVSE